jgi:hypothetical protein
LLDTGLERLVETKTIWFLSVEQPPEKKKEKRGKNKKKSFWGEAPCYN